MEQLSMNEFKELNRKKLTWLADQSVDMKLELLRNHLSICQLMVNELLEEEVIEKAGERYTHQKPHSGRYSRWGYNPGSVRIGDKKLKVDIPRIMDSWENQSERLDRYEQLKNNDAPTDQLIQGVLRGLSTRDYERVIDYLQEGFGLSKSEVSRRFVERTKEKLELFQNRRLDHHEFVAIFLDGKYLAKEQIIIALGVTIKGDKIPLSFVHAPTENSIAVKDLFRDLIQRGLNYEQGMLFVLDGSKGFHKAVKEIFDSKSVIQRCCWHKRENILAYIPESEHQAVKSDYNRALRQPTYEDAKADLLQLSKRLEPINLSAARSVKEGLEEILTLHRLGMHELFGRSFSTTNCIENVNSQLGKYLRKVKYWKNSDQRHRWVAAGLLEIEHSMRKVANYRKLDKLRKAIIFEISSDTSSEISTKIGT